MSIDEPSAVLHTLNNADGSATYIAPKKAYTIIAGVNYPLEVPYRSDEIPDSTFIEVNLRPHNGVGMVKERHIEEIVRRTLKAIVLVEETPRLMLQVTLQILDVEVDESLPGGVKSGGQGESYLNILPGCINAAILSCLDAGVQMNGIAGAALIGIMQDKKIMVWPSLKDRKYCQSLHVFGFNSRQDCLLMESEGAFEYDQWQTALNLAKSAISGNIALQNGEDVEMHEYTNPNTIFDLMRKSVEGRVNRSERPR